MGYILVGYNLWNILEKLFDHLSDKFLYKPFLGKTCFKFLDFLHGDVFRWSLENIMEWSCCVLLFYLFLIYDCYA